MNISLCILCFFSLLGCTTVNEPKLDSPLPSSSDSPNTPPAQETEEQKIQQHNQAILEMDRQRDLQAQDQTELTPPTFVFRLTDGSVLKGQLLDIENNRLQVRSLHLGVLALPLNRVVQMSRPGWSDSAASEPSSSPPSLDNVEIESLQRSLSANPILMSQISQLQSNPVLTNILSDPEILDLIQQQDLEALQGNQKIQQLMQDPSIQQLLNALSY